MSTFSTVRSAFLGLGAAACLALSAPVFAQSLPVEGRDYIRLASPLIPADQTQVEVVEFFSYGCIHCADFSPILKAWEAQHPNVRVRRVAVGGEMVHNNLARLYYTLDALGELKRLDSAVFKAIFEEKQRLFKVDAQAKWYASKGGDAEKFTGVWNSFGVDSQLRRAEQLAETWKIDATPTLVVGGQFVVQGANFDDMLANTDKLVAMLGKKPAK
ncbi:MAG: thiol:disulfide interchange protein DsbA/DsbL [Zoogloeaceae bacterium]|jgi:thiol:disulfide interchange protein DsbA|nr:thiol:disulfide interchange protein DsbA/DsbL [Zoogloeaceae bacterium]